MENENLELHTDGMGIVAEIVRQNAEPRVIDIMPTGDQAGVLIVPKGQQAVSTKPFLDQYLPHPERIEGSATLHTLDAFIAHAGRFGREGQAAIFADINGPSLLACYDYHAAEDAPAWDKHRASYLFPLSKEWKAWEEINSEPMSTTELGEFIEDRIEDLRNQEDGDKSLQALAETLQGSFASITQLVELGRGLRVHIKSQVHNVQNRDSGEADIVFKTEHQNEAGGLLKVPNLFLIGIPVFESGDLYQIAVRLRYRVREGQIHWILSLYRPDRVLSHAFEEAVTRVAGDTGIPVFRGTPETPQNTITPPTL